MQKIGFVGYGAMARRMGRRLADAGHAVVATDRSHAGPELDGVRLIGSAAELAAGVEIILISVPADAALEQAFGSADGILEGAAPGTLLIDLSSVSPEASRDLARRGGEAGLPVIDAPVSGSTPEAERGELVVLAGGAKADIEAARPVLEVIGKKIVHCGPAGSGSSMKLVINGVMGAAMASIAEAVALGLRSGLDRDLLLETLSGLAVVSAHHARKLSAAAARDYEPQFPTRLMLKDMGLVLDDTARLGVPAPTLAAATQLFALTSRTRADADYSAVIAELERLAGGT